MDLEYMVYQLKYDSVHGQFKGTIEAREGAAVPPAAVRPPFQIRACGCHLAAPPVCVCRRACAAPCVSRQAS